MTLGNAAAARVRLIIVWCKSCQRPVEPDPAEMAARYGAETPVLDWREGVVCSRCGSRQAGMLVSGDKTGGSRGEPLPIAIVKRQTFTLAYQHATTDT
jgi:hypothetical protein